MNNIGCLASVMIENYIYLSNVDFNALFKIDLISLEVTFLGRFQNNSVESRFLHLSAEMVNDELWFLPGLSHEIGIYNFYRKTFDKIFISNDFRNDIIICREFLKGNETEILLFPRLKGKKAIFINNKKIVKEISIEKGNDNAKDNGSDFLATYACSANEGIYYVIWDSNKIGFFNFYDGKEIVYSLDVDKLIGTIGYINGNFFVGTNKEILCYDSQFKKKKCIYRFEDATLRTIWVEKYIDCGNSIAVIFHWIDRVIFVDKLNDKYTCVKIEKSALNDNFNTSERDIKEAFLWNEYIVILPYRYSELIMININDKSVKYQSLHGSGVFESTKGLTVQEKRQNNLYDFLKSL